MSDQLQVTPASQWKRKAHIVQLPSGMVAELQRPSFVDTIMSDGSLPEGLAQVIFEGFNGGGTSEWKPKPEDLPRLAELIATICRAAFVAPCIVERGVEPNYDAGQIALSDIPDFDRKWVMDWVLSGGQAGQAATKFPKKQMAGVAPVSAKRALRKTP